MIDTQHEPKLIESDMESCMDEKKKTRNVRGRHQKPKKTKKKSLKSKSDTEADDYQGDAEMGLGDDSDVDTITATVTGLSRKSAVIKIYYKHKIKAETLFY